MQLVQGYPGFPGHCLTCGNTESSKPAIDLERKDPGNMIQQRRVYICADCVVYAFQLVGPSVGKVAASLEAEANMAQDMVRLVDENQRLTERAEKAEKVLRDWRDIVDVEAHT